MPTTIDVVIESGRRRTFASALDWPGLARASTSRDGALAALDAYRGRYAAVLAVRSVVAPRGALAVREELAGDATTDFGAPSQIAERDHRALRRADRARLAAILDACWTRFDQVADGAGELALGPRGGGRQVGAVRRHVTDADVVFARKLGLKVAATSGDPAAVAALRARVLGVIDATVSPDREGTWPLRYAVRRAGWHVCDHLFEIEDRSIRA